MSFLFIFCFCVTATAAMSADQILKKVERSLRSKDETAKVSMEIVEKNGKSKKRNLVIKKKNKNKKQQVLVRLEKPTDIRGVGLLSVIDGSSEDQWLYLPSSKRSRRIISSKKKDSFLGSEFSYEDFSPTTYSKFKNKIVKTDKIKGQKAYIIESKSNKGVGPYSRILTWVNAKDYKILQTQYFDQKGRKLKVMIFKDYKKFGNKSWRAQLIRVKNVQNKRSTKLLLSELKLNTGLSDNEFSKRALESY
jgi:outer membrane lipoprotein-sorting protein